MGMLALIVPCMLWDSVELTLTHLCGDAIGDPTTVPGANFDFAANSDVSCLLSI